MLNAIGYEGVWRHFQTGVHIASVTAIPVLETSFQIQWEKQKNAVCVRFYCVVAMAED